MIVAASRCLVWKSPSRYEDADKTELVQDEPQVGGSASTILDAAICHARQPFGLAGY